MSSFFSYVHSVINFGRIIIHNYDISILNGYITSYATHSNTNITSNNTWGVIYTITYIGNSFIIISHFFF